MAHTSAFCADVWGTEERAASSCSRVGSIAPEGGGICFSPAAARKRAPHLCRAFCDKGGMRVWEDNKPILSAIVIPALRKPREGRGTHSSNWVRG